MTGIEYKAHPGETPFISACIDGKLEIAKALFAQGGVDLDARTDADTTVLEELVFKAGNRPLNFTITKLQGKDVTITDPSEIRKLIGSHPDDEFATYFATALFVLQNGADTDNVNQNGQSAVFTATGEGADWLVELLAKHGANLNTSDRWGLTPLHYACRMKYPRIVEILLENGADKDSQDDFGFTPAFEATISKSPEILKILAKYGANFNLGLKKAYKANPPGTTPQMYAEKNGFKDLVAVFKALSESSAALKQKVEPRMWKWNETSAGFAGVEIKEGKLLWFSHREDRHSPSIGASFQDFNGFLLEGPPVSDVPSDISDEIKAWISR